MIVFTWSHVLRSDLKGGRHGQLDAYRHALASATVSYTVGEWAVSLTTWVFESGGKDSNKMDIHNNRIGAKIGSAPNRSVILSPLSGKLSKMARFQLQIPPRLLGSHLPSGVTANSGNSSADK